MNSTHPQQSKPTGAQRGAERRAPRAQRSHRDRDLITVRTIAQRCPTPQVLNLRRDENLLTGQTIVGGPSFEERDQGTAPDRVGVPCKRRRCPSCGPLRWQKYARAVILSGAKPRAASLMLLTLTAPGIRGGLVDEASINEWNNGAAERWHRFVHMLHRTLPAANIQYSRVGELQERGAIHYHVIIAGIEVLPKRLIQRLAVRAGFGPICDVRRVRGALHAASYVTKYLLKDVDEWPTGRRVWSTSRHWKIDWRPRNKIWTGTAVDRETGEVFEFVSAWVYDAAATSRAAKDPLLRAQLFDSARASPTPAI